MSAGFVHCWKCDETLSTDDTNGIPVVALTVDVVLCDDCAVELANRIEDAAPSVEDLSAWRYPDEPNKLATFIAETAARVEARPSWQKGAIDRPGQVPMPKLGMTVRDKATGEVFATLGTFPEPGTAAATGGGNT